MTYEHGKMLKGFREIQSDFFKRLESSIPALEGESGRKARLRPLYPSRRRTVCLRTLIPRMGVILKMLFPTTALIRVLMHRRIARRMISTMRTMMPKSIQMRGNVGWVRSGCGRMTECRRQEFGAICETTSLLKSSFAYNIYLL